MQGLLKSQFQLISDVATGLILVAGRGGPDAITVRSYREGSGRSWRSRLRRWRRSTRSRRQRSTRGHAWNWIPQKRAHWRQDHW